MQNIKTVAFNAFFWIWTTILALIAVPIAAFGGTTAMRRYARFWMQGIQWALRSLVGLDYRVSGIENLPAGPVILAAKHQSAWETLFFHIERVDLAIALKHELTRIPLFGWYLMKARNIKLDRGGAAKTLRSLVKGGKQAVAQGDTILIFPEGTRTAPGAAPDYKPGVAALYGALDVPCVPVALNSGCFWSKSHFAKKPGIIDVRFLPAIEPGKKRQDFMAELEANIEHATTELVNNARVLEA